MIPISALSWFLVLCWRFGGGCIRCVKGFFDRLAKSFVCVIKKLVNNMTHALLAILRGSNKPFSVCVKRQQS